MNTVEQNDGWYQKLNGLDILVILSIAEFNGGGTKLYSYRNHESVQSLHLSRRRVGQARRARQSGINAFSSMSLQHCNRFCRWHLELHPVSRRHVQCKHLRIHLR